MEGWGGDRGIIRGGIDSSMAQKAIQTRCELGIASTIKAEDFLLALMSIASWMTRIIHSPSFCAR